MMRIDGRCHCGHVAYEAEIDPEQVGICHCTDCQTLTGSPFRVTVLARREAIRLTGHEPKIYVKTGDNGRRRFQHFCPECGSPVFTSGEGADAEEWGIRWGGIRQRDQLAPKRQIWCRSAVPWIHHLEDLPGKLGG
ncbi:GFA family protein [Inquilinus sp. Marseille-Q2685]|uniref:GFA family protein n=1 Tax=Inquilinus sp. Marseille-Q2685 TaxID=2866581 RepID=UPI001CE4839F|nr:GFA family protein [Inquilinus sp. Marseille-Q2685]